MFFFIILHLNFYNHNKIIKITNIKIIFKMYKTFLFSFNDHENINNIKIR